MAKETNSLKHQIIRMSNTLVDKSTSFGEIQQKLFYIALASLSHGVNRKNEVEIDKEELFEYLNWTDTNRWTRIRGQLRQLCKNSWISFGDDKSFNDGFILTRSRSTRKKIYIAFEPYYLPLLIELSGNYTRLLDDDVVLFDRKASMMLYQRLMRFADYHRDKETGKCTCDFTTMQLRQVFGLGEDDYCVMVKNKVSKSERKKFNRTLFEKKVLNPAIAEINCRCRCIRNLKCVKIKADNGRVKYYQFLYEYRDPRGERDDITVAEVHEFRDDMEFHDYDWLNN